MDKAKIYDTLREDGARLKAINFYTDEQLKDLYIERFGNEPDATGQETKQNDENIDNNEPDAVEIHTLFFDCGFWCDDLNQSFAPGYYRPVSIDEYVVLKKYSVREV